jgi:hypothetical protein
MFVPIVLRLWNVERREDSAHQEDRTALGRVRQTTTTVTIFTVIAFHPITIVNPAIRKHPNFIFLFIIIIAAIVIVIILSKPLAQALLDKFIVAAATATRRRLNRRKR